jgi:protease-4
MPRRPSLALTLVAAAAPLLLAGCITVNVTPPPTRARPKVVLEDPGAGHDRVALIEVRGLLVDSRTPGLLADGPNPVDRFAEHLDLARRDARVKALIVRITSPGGTVTASDIMHHDLRRFADETKRPVVVSMGEVAASGGYYLALAADTIVAQPTTITASIGVILPTMNFSDGLARIGVRSRAVVSGPNKDLASPFEPPREAQYAVLQTMVDDFYARFQTLVRTRRPAIAPADFPGVTDGRIVSGERALALGLVDELGGVHEAFARAKHLAGLERATLVKYLDAQTLPSSVYAAAPAPQPEINLLQINLAGALPTPAESSGFYYLWLPPQ